MELNEVNYADVQPVDGYGSSFIRVGGMAHPAPILLTPTGVRSWEGLEDSAPLLTMQGLVDVILFGMGPEIALLPSDLLLAIEARGLGAEVMSSPQACRTYNVLVGEGRRVALAILTI